MGGKRISSIVLMLLAGITALSVDAANPMSRSVDGVAIYVGVVPAAIVRGHASEHAESRMHGGAAVGGQHVMIALFDDKSGARIADADVSATVSGPKRYREEKHLEPMLVGSAPSYGNYFSLYEPGAYRIALQIRPAGAPRDIRTTFTWTLPGSGSAGHP